MPLTVSHVMAECSLISGRVIDVLSKGEAPPSCHHPLLELKNHMHVLGFRSIACTHPFLHGDQVYVPFTSKCHLTPATVCFFLPSLLTTQDYHLTRAESPSQIVY